MTPEAERFLAKASKLLDEAGSMLGIRLDEAAGRTAYLAAFHAAQALVFERTGNAAKTHRGVQAEFQRITPEFKGFDPELKTFLSRSYNLKAIADYETMPDVGISEERARASVAEARRFVAYMAKLLQGDS